MSEETINVSKAEWEELRKLKEELPTIINQIRSESTKDRFKQLQATDTPEKVRERAKKYYQLHKDEIKAKRLEKKNASLTAVEKTPGPS